MKTVQAHLGFLISTFCFLLCYSAASAATRYVWQESPSPAPPYTNWATAAHVIQDAVDAADPGDTVLVTNGVYATGGRSVIGLNSHQVTNRVVVDKPLFVRSVNGSECTSIISGESYTRCVYLASGAILSGFNLSGGHTWSLQIVPWDYQSSAGGGVWCENGAVVSDCIITNNQASLGAGAYGGTLINCTLTGNSTFNDGGGGGAESSTLSNCVLIGNSARFGGGADRCTMNNCILTDNRAVYGGGAAGSKLTNCTLTANTAICQGGGAFLCSLNNCIVYFNINTSDQGPNRWGSSMNYCCTTPLPTKGVGNIDLDPLFVDVAGGNLRLQSNSPCINTGNNDSVVGPTDLDGHPRIVGGTVDMGAYEFVPPTAAELVQRLIEQVNASDLKHKQPLLASLNAALESIGRGNCNAAAGQLGAFQNKVRAQVSDPGVAKGLAEAAAQVIAALDCDGSPHVAARIRSLKRQANGRMQLQFEGAAVPVYHVEASTNLVDWEAIGATSRRADGTFEFEDPDASKHQSRFYRVVEP